MYIYASQRKKPLEFCSFVTSALEQRELVAKSERIGRKSSIIGPPRVHNVRFGKFFPFKPFVYNLNFSIYSKNISDE